jgi:hypothetical protein
MERSSSANGNTDSVERSFHCRRVEQVALASSDDGDFTLRIPREVVHNETAEKASSADNQNSLSVHLHRVCRQLLSF